MFEVEEGKRAQCLLFIAGQSPRQSGNSSTDSSIKGYAILPQSFRSRHPEVVELFSSNDIRVMTDAQDDFSLQMDLKDITFEMLDVQLLHMSLVSDSIGPSTLYIGVDESDRDFVRLLLQKKVESFHLSRKLLTGYISMPNNDDLKAVKHFVSNSKAISWRHVKGGTILHLAVENNQENLVNLLLQYGADVNAKRLDGTTPLHIAAMEGRVKVVKTLLQHGGDVNAEAEMEDERGETPLVYAQQRGHRQVVQLLIESGADINIVFRHCTHTCIRGARFMPYLPSFGKFTGGEKVTVLYAVALEGDFELMKVILRHQPDVTNEYNRKAFHHVLFEPDDNFKDVFMQMKEYGFTIDCHQLDSSVKFLLGAIHKNCFEIVRSLLEAGVDANKAYETRSFEKLKPLHMAARHAGEDIIQLLLDHGADINAKLKDKFPIHCAVESNNISVVKCLIANNADFLDKAYLIFIAAGAGNSEMIEFLLLNGYPLTFKNGYTMALGQAACKGHIDVIELLFKYGAQLGSECVDYRSPIHDGIMKGEPEIFQVILDHIFTDTKMIKYIEGPLLHFSKRLNVPRNIYPFDSLTAHQTILNVLAQHILKLKAGSLCTSDENLSSLWHASESIESFQKRCEMEIAQMKREKVDGSEVLFYDILTQSLTQLVGFARNDSIFKTMKDDDYRFKFPIYFSVLKRQFKKGLQRETFIQQGIKICNVLFPEKKFNDLPYELKVKVVNYLNNCDLLVLNNVLPTETGSEGE